MPHNTSFSEGYILFEMTDARGSDAFYNFDAMGWTPDENKALDWVAQNPEYRCYKYCPGKQI